MKINHVVVKFDSKKSTKQKLFERMNIISGTQLTEVDWEDSFSDVSKKCLNLGELKNYLNDVVDDSKSAFTLDKPHVSTKSVTYDEEGEIDVQSFINDITQVPKQILVVSEKMEKSSTDDSISVTIGIPALRGLVYDISNKEFYIVNTCPGAGSCAMICYARKGRFIWASKSMKQTRVLNLLLNDPELFKAKVKNEIESELINIKGKQIQFRWNDSGDFFTKKYFAIAQEITRELQEKGYNFKSYAYTKMGDIINMDNKDVTTNFSDDANKRETGKVNTETAKKSMIVPKPMFKDLLIPKGSSYEKDERGKAVFRNPNGLDQLKDRISKEYNIDKGSLLSYDEMMNTPAGEKGQYNVIVMPTGDGDVGAQREDVKVSFLLYH